MLKSKLTLCSHLVLCMHISMVLFNFYYTRWSSNSRKNSVGVPGGPVTILFLNLFYEQYMPNICVCNAEVAIQSVGDFISVSISTNAAGKKPVFPSIVPLHHPLSSCCTLVTVTPGFRGSSPAF